MEIALVNEERMTPAPGLKGKCPACGAEAIPKCGTKVIWHWAHKGKRHCDPWWENETDWHRAWKSHFPQHLHEIVMFDERTGEKHVADIRTERGMIIEVQHSAMPVDELHARESFYKHMVWIVDGRAFKTLFEVHPEPLPHPKSPMLDDMVFMTGWAYFRPSEKVPGLELVEMHKASTITERIMAEYRGHHFFTWKRPRKVWYDAKAPVLIDFGDDRLLRLQRYGKHQEFCVQWMSKGAFIEKNGGKLVVAAPLEVQQPA